MVKEGVWSLVIVFVPFSQHQVRLVGSLQSKEGPGLVTQQQRLVWECGCVCQQGQQLWLVGGEGKLGIISTQAPGKITLTVSPSQVCHCVWTSCYVHVALHLQIISRVICAHYLPVLDLILVGTLNFNLAAIECASK